ncbi:hypothetical protein GGI06_005981 [Coemansia sp. S85]|nr:hypothetical protein GGI06_005981 [Coemansia sp. S85]
MASQDEVAVFQAFDAYDFDNDAAFQLGLQSIEFGKEHTKVAEEAKIFYYSRRIAPIDQDKYAAWKLATSSKSDKEPPPSTSFAEIVGMIARGETIPGIRQIPDELSSLAPSTSTSVAPRKPWEEQSDSK